MPIYEYQCATCGNITEAWQRFSDEPLSTCPACGGALTKLISNCAFHLRGSGWYVSDYGSRRPNSASPDTAKEAGDSGVGKASPAADTPASSDNT
ncbi:MAG: FmdB family zinc ribbon protein [Desulfobaccales bacterium]